MILLAALVAGYVGLKLGTITQALNGALSVTTFLLLKDVFSRQNPRSRRYVMCPYVDMGNHRSAASSDLAYEYFRDAFSLETNDAFGAGEQVFISYGRRGNADLLQFYGFVERDNPWTTYELRGALGRLGATEAQAARLRELGVAEAVDALVVDRAGVKDRDARAGANKMILA